MKVQIHMHEQAYRSKPQKAEIAKISNTITEKKETMDVCDFAKAAGEEGRTFTPAVFDGSRKKECFVSQQVYALDFDSGFTIEEFMERANKYNITPAFIYETFSSTEENPKFRAVFINDCRIDDREAASILIQMLQMIFPESDKSCKDVARMFFGGKSLRMTDCDATINLYDISSSLQAFLRTKDGKNYARKIKQVGNKLNVAVEDNLLRIHRKVYADCENEDFTAMTSNILVNAEDSSFFYVIEKNAGYTGCKREKNTNNNTIAIRGITESLLMERCPLFQDFYETDIPHELKFLLATNLLSVSGGKHLFFKGRINHVEKWEQDWKYIKSEGYLPQRCKGSGCPYYEQCRAATMLDKVTSKIQKKYEEEFVELSEAERFLAQYMLDSLNSSGDGIYLISAQTAIGKTFTYYQILKQNYKSVPFMIVVPTIKLQKEVQGELLNLGVPVFATVNIGTLLDELGLNDLKDEVDLLYKRGFGFKVKPKVQEYLNTHNLYEYQESQLKKYLDGSKKLDGSTCVVTTHAMFLSLPNDKICNYRVIVDEDILMTVFKNTASVSFEDLETALKANAIPGMYMDLIRQLLQAEDGDLKTGKPGKLGKEQLEEIYEKKLPVNASLIDFLEADTYHVDVQNERIDYFKAKVIPSVKMTIVSATLNEELYKRFCKGREIHMLEVPAAEYKGRLIQYTAHSMSRSNMQEIGYDRIRKCVEDLVREPVKNVITFKMYTTNAAIYYGKTEGYNEYKGKDLVVIGTPHNVPFVYRLTGAYLGYDAEDKLRVQFTENKYYSFKFMTFKDDHMRNLQFYFIESELEQAIGRARLLRCDCNVYLFSNFPCRQANIIQDEYLPDNTF